MYEVISLLSIIIRQYYLPNPYIFYFESSLYADIFNIFIGGAILHMFSFFLTSSIYEKGKNATWVGCILYCINYTFNTVLIIFLCYNFIKLNLSYIILISFVVNFIIWIAFKNLKKRIHSIM